MISPSSGRCPLLSRGGTKSLPSLPSTEMTRLVLQAAFTSPWYPDSRSPHSQTTPRNSFEPEAFSEEQVKRK